MHPTKTRKTGKTKKASTTSKTSKTTKTTAKKTKPRTKLVTLTYADGTVEQVTLAQAKAKRHMDAKVAEGSSCEWDTAKGCWVCGPPRRMRC